MNEKSIQEFSERQERSDIYRLCQELGAEERERLAPNGNLEYMFDRIDEMDNLEALEIIREAIKFHQDDWNFPSHLMQKMEVLMKGSDADKLSYSLELRIEACLLKYSSPYPKVRSIMNFEDPSMHYETLRAYVLGVGWSCIGAGVNTFFNFRFPHISISSAVVQILVYPYGLLWARVVPDWGFTFRGSRFSLNPGPYNFKEQMFVTIIFSSGMSSFQAYSMIMVQHLEVYYGNP